MKRFISALLVFVFIFCTVPAVSIQGAAPKVKLEYVGEMIESQNEITETILFNITNDSSKKITVLPGAVCDFITEDGNTSVLSYSTQENKKVVIAPGETKELYIGTSQGWVNFDFATKKEPVTTTLYFKSGKKFYSGHWTCINKKLKGEGLKKITKEAYDALKEQ